MVILPMVMSWILSAGLKPAVLTPVGEVYVRHILRSAAEPDLKQAVAKSWAGVLNGCGRSDRIFDVLPSPRFKTMSTGRSYAEVTWGETVYVFVGDDGKAYVQTMYPELYRDGIMFYPL
jgi:hypothetical protein